MNRRHFFGSLAGAAAAVAISAYATDSLAASSVPILRGDGAHDDTVALQAMLNGRDVMRPDGTLMCGSDHIVLPPGQYAVSSTLWISRPSYIMNSKFIAVHDGLFLDGKSGVDYRKVIVTRNSFIRRESSALPTQFGRRWF